MGILLGLVLVVSLVGIAIAFIADTARSIDDDYKIISDATIYRNQDISIIVLTWTNAGNLDVELHEIELLGTITSKTIPESDDTYTTKAHEGNTYAWTVPNVPEKSIIRMNFTFTDGSEIPIQHRLD